MLVITQNTHNALLEEIRFCKSVESSWRCIILKFSLAKNKPDNWFSIAAEKINTYLGSEGAIYLFPDNDVYILTRQAVYKTLDILFKSCSPVFLDIPQSIAAQIYELPVHFEYLVLDLEQKKEQDVPVKGNVKETQKIYNPLSDPTYAPMIKTLSSRRSARANPEILVSEDDPFSSRLVCKVIEGKFTSYAAFDGQKTIESYLFNAPDVLFLDIGLPDMNGLEILSDLLVADPEAYIVMISGSGSKENVLKAINIGAKGFIAKPFTREKIFQYIERCPSIQKKWGKSLAN